MRRVAIAAAVVAAVATPARAQVQDDTAEASASVEDDAPVEVDDGEVIEMVGVSPPGAAHVVGAEDMERFEHDDVHKILAAVPGVYTREEDGYGLRPNIGMRGTGSERSAKIALLEDGVPIAPAPYSAPAAYYFPLVTRMNGVEVLKGPSSIRFGPNTVGGAVNLLSKPMPGERVVGLDLAGGSNLYGKGHVYYGDSTDHVAWLVEGVKVRTDGFKRLDGGGDTGFDKHDVLARVRGKTVTSGDVYHQVDLRLGYADEVSDETYTGLTDADFDDDPYRRYAGTQLDRMDWRHLQGRLTYRMIWPGSVDLTLQAYHHDFSRDWRKLNRFATDRDLRDILGNPDAGLNAVFYAVLTGAADSASPAETLLIGTNSRSFISQGLQATARLERSWLGWTHHLEVGTRFHRDSADRLHTEDGFLMAGGQLVADGGARAVTLDSVGETLAWASHAQHRVAIGPVTVSVGLRTEVMVSELDNDLDPDASSGRRTDAVVLPGVGLVYQPTPELGLVAGVHRGFAPVPPGQGDTVDPELSVSYEAGGRYTHRVAAVEAIGFFSDYSNLIGVCTFSSGCDMDLLGQAFNGGSVRSYGVEGLASAELSAGGLAFPLRLGYTLQRSIFQEDFASTNPLWGDVSDGDSLPYLPTHQLHTRAAVAGTRWEVATSLRYASSMRDVAGQGDMDPSEVTDSAFVVNLAARVRVGRWGEVYATVDNILDEVHVTSRRPFGARPGVPRLIVVGYKNRL